MDRSQKAASRAEGERSESPADGHSAIRIAVEQHLAKAVLATLHTLEEYKLIALMRDGRDSPIVGKVAATHTDSFNIRRGDVELLIKGRAHLMALADRFCHAVGTLEEYQHLCSGPKKNQFLSNLYSELGVEVQDEESLIPPSLFMPASYDVVTELDHLRSATGRLWVRGMSLGFPEGGPDSDDKDTQDRGAWFAGLDSNDPSSMDVGALTFTNTEGAARLLQKNLNAIMRRTGLDDSHRASIAGFYDGERNTYRIMGVFIPSRILTEDAFLQALGSDAGIRIDLQRLLSEDFTVSYTRNEPDLALGHFSEVEFARLVTLDLKLLCQKSSLVGDCLDDGYVFAFNDAGCRDLFKEALERVAIVAGYQGDMEFHFDSPPKGQLHLFVPRALADDTSFRETLRSNPNYSEYLGRIVALDDERASLSTKTAFGKFAQALSASGEAPISINENFLSDFLDAATKAITLHWPQGSHPPDELCINSGPFRQALISELRQVPLSVLLLNSERLNQFLVSALDNAVGEEPLPKALVAAIASPVRTFLATWAELQDGVAQRIKRKATSEQIISKDLNAQSGFVFFETYVDKNSPTRNYSCGIYSAEAGEKFCELLNHLGARYNGGLNGRYAWTTKTPGEEDRIRVHLFASLAEDPLFRNLLLSNDEIRLQIRSLRRMNDSAHRLTY